MDALSELADGIDGLLPQTQCRDCGYAGCRPYAEAIAAGEADINRCPPGGIATIHALAALLGRPAPALDVSRGVPGPSQVARIDERVCIGCTLCIAACPIDAIIGAPKRMHGVLTTLCSGCTLCVAPCPVDCIEMVPAERLWSAADATAARARHQRRARRLAAADVEAMRNARARKRNAAIAAAIARARARRESMAPDATRA
jgi:electron transport complex protein RnfB